MDENEIKGYLHYKFNVMHQLGVKLTGEQVIHVHSLKSEISIDNYMRQIIINS